MYNNMKRKDKLLDRESALKIIDKANFATISMVDNGEAYAVPLSIARVKNTLYFHTARLGRKNTIFAKKPKVQVSFVTSVKVPDLIKPEQMRKNPDVQKMLSKVFTTGYQCTMVGGRVIELTGEEKKFGLTAICQKYTPNFAEFFDMAIDKAGDATRVYKIEIEEISAKGKIF